MTSSYLSWWLEKKKKEDYNCAHLFVVKFNFDGLLRKKNIYVLIQYNKNIKVLVEHPFFEGIYY